MKSVIGLVLGISLLAACQKSEVVSPFTGNQTTYALQSASAYPVSGTVTFKERVDGAVTISVRLAGTSAGTSNPVHLHLGDVSLAQAAVAALLSPVTGQTGESDTILKELADETPVTYKSLIALDACVKVHLSDVGQASNIILAAGNVGSATAKAVAGGRLGVAVCASK
jgi:uncharacterized lipoprotein YbaY